MAGCLNGLMVYDDRFPGGESKSDFPPAAFIRHPAVDVEYQAMAFQYVEYINGKGQSVHEPDQRADQVGQVIIGLFLLLRTMMG